MINGGKMISLKDVKTKQEGNSHKIRDERTYERQCRSWDIRGNMTSELYYFFTSCIRGTVAGF